MRLDLAAAAQAIGARLYGPGTFASSVTSDSRSIAAGALFVALRGERFDGHAFVEAAFAQGALAAMIDGAAMTAGTVKPSQDAGTTLLVVDDTRRGLQALAAWWRDRFSIPVVGIVGSNGKTTTKEMTAAIMREHFGDAHVLATAGNLNNDIGVPLTILRLGEEHRIAVVEMGMNHPGETAELAAIARPTVALVTNAQREHQEFMKSVAEVAAEHGALIAALPADGIAIVNADDAYASYWRRRAEGRAILDFGMAAPAVVTASFRAGAIESVLDLSLPEGRTTAHLAVPGRHNVMNALGAAAAASVVGVPPSTIGRGLGRFSPAKGRLQIKRAAAGATIIDDTYNANPDSVRAAIDVLVQSPGRTVLVLGDMGEVGSDGPAFHREVGEYAAGRGVDRLLALGQATGETVAAFPTGGRHFTSVDDLVDTLADDAGSGTTILVKGSRFMKMERVVDALIQGKAAACC